MIAAIYTGTIYSGPELLGGPAFMSALALITVWSLFLLLRIQIRKCWMRFLGCLFLAFTLSSLLGISQTSMLDPTFFHGGQLGNWIYMNCKLTHTLGLVLFLSWLGFIGSTLLATDWLFHEYITYALGLSSQKGPDRSLGFSNKSPKKPRKTQKAEPKPKKTPLNQASFLPEKQKGSQIGLTPENQGVTVLKRDTPRSIGTAGSTEQRLWGRGRESTTESTMSANTSSAFAEDVTTPHQHEDTVAQHEDTVALHDDTVRAQSEQGALLTPRRIAESHVEAEAIERKETEAESRVDAESMVKEEATAEAPLAPEAATAAEQESQRFGGAANEGDDAVDPTPSAAGNEESDKPETEEEEEYEYEEVEEDEDPEEYEEVEVDESEDPEEYEEVEADEDEDPEEYEYEEVEADEDEDPEEYEEVEEDEDPEEYEEVEVEVEADEDSEEDEETEADEEGESEEGDESDAEEDGEDEYEYEYEYEEVEAGEEDGEEYEEIDQESATNENGNEDQGESEPSHAVKPENKVAKKKELPHPEKESPEEMWAKEVTETVSIEESALTSDIDNPVITLSETPAIEGDIKPSQHKPPKGIPVSPETLSGDPLPTHEWFVAPAEYKRKRKHKHRKEQEGSAGQ